MRFLDESAACLYAAPFILAIKTSNGIGLISFESATLVTLGGCRVENRAPMYTIADTSKVCSLDADGVLNSPNLGPRSPNYACGEGRITVWLLLPCNCRGIPSRKSDRDPLVSPVHDETIHNLQLDLPWAREALFHRVHSARITTLLSYLHGVG